MDTHYCPQVAQLVAAHPPQDDPAEEETVSPLPPLLTKPQTDISLRTFLLLHERQFGFSFPNTKYSKSMPHLSQ
jgi:hypothetical protein